MNSPLERETVELESIEIPTLKVRKPRIWTMFAILVLSLIVGNSAINFTVESALGFVNGMALARGLDPESAQVYTQEVVLQPLPILLMSLIPFQLALVGLLLFAASESPVPFKQLVGWLPQSGRRYGKFKLSTMACFTLSTALAINFATYFLAGPPAQQDAISATVMDGSWITITVLSIVLSVIPALVEETLFRGYIQRRFLNRWSPMVAITVSTLLFAGMHLDSWQHIVAVIPLGAVAGLLAYRTNSVKPGMLVHGLHNVGAVAMPTLISVLQPSLGDAGVGLLVLAAIPVIGLIGLPAVISLLRKSKPLPVVEVIETEEPVESLSVLNRAPLAADYATDSVLTSQAL